MFSPFYHAFQLVPLITPNFYLPAVPFDVLFSILSSPPLVHRNFFQCFYKHLSPTRYISPFVFFHVGDPHFFIAFFTLLAGPIVKRLSVDDPVRHFAGLVLT